MRRLALLAIPAMITVAGCGSSSKTTTPTTAAPASPSAGVGSQIAPILPADRSPAGTIGTKPAVTVPSGPAPTTLETADLIPGSGPAAQAGQQVTVQYVGVSYTTKQEFDSSWSRHQAFPFALGAGQVIPGWDQGVAGMKVGGRRELIIPPALAYGARSPGAGIAPNDTLIFIVDLVSVG
jgi:peptidylprolyl isomerase